MRRVCWIVTVGLLSAGQAVAEQEGPYVALEIGFGNGASMALHGTDNDVATTCDGWLVPVDGTNAGCDPPPSAWSSDIDGSGSGVATSLTAFGYRFGNIGAELEYAHSALTYDATAELTVTDVVSVDKSQNETETAETRVETAMYGSLFANAYWHFSTDSRVSPYVGIGIGMSDVSIDYFNRWKRNDNPDAITTFAGHPDEENLRRTLAGTTTIASAKLKDTVSAYQVIAGVDFPISDLLTVTLKAKAVEYGTFESGRLPWDQLRSHHSSRSPGGDDVTYDMSTSDLRSWSVSFGMRYGLGRR